MIARPDSVATRSISHTRPLKRMITLSPNPNNHHHQLQQQQQQPPPITTSLDPNLITAFKYCALSSFIGAWGGVAAKYNLQYAQFGDTLQDQCAVLFSIPPELAPESSQLSMLQALGLKLPFLLPVCITLIGVIVKLIQLGMTLGFNTWGLSYALRASHLAPTSVTNTICSGFSFLMNAGLGVLLFQEHLSQKFMIGLLFILMGLFLICHDQIKQPQPQKES